MKSKFCQSSAFTKCKSELTGRLLKINTETDKFFLPENAYMKVLPIAKKMNCWDSKRVLLRVQTLLASFSSLNSNQEFADAIDDLLDDAIQNQAILGYKKNAVNWLIRLWAEGVIGLPVLWPFSGQVRFAPDADSCGKNSWIFELAVLGKQISAKPTHSTQALIKLAGSTQGLQELGDITPSTTSLVAIQTYRNLLPGMVTPLLIFQREKYDMPASVIDSWGLGKKRRGFDHSYQWVLEKDPSLTDWRETVSNWLNDRKHGFAQRATIMDRFFAYLIENPQLTRSVEEYCRRSAVNSPTWPEWIETQDITGTRIQAYRNVISEFIDWYITKSLTGEDDFGRPVRSPLHYNPITRVRMSSKQSETHRDALPLRYINELIKLITDDDFAWPKTLRADYFAWKNPETGLFEKMWSPVRTYAMLVKLHLPLRTFQVRMLDSGEADTERLVDDRWDENTGPLKPVVKKQVKNGFLRRFRDTRTEREFTGLYVNTNKTADVYKDEKDKGYEVPWQHKEIIALAVALREWQEQHNPIKSPTSWDSLHDKSILRTYSLDALRQREPVCFLFRDPCESHPDEPVRGDRMQTFWASLLDEMEKRYAASGKSLPDGSPIKFILKRQEQGGYLTPAYDLHSLRVSLITAYATEGGVPIQVLSKCIAGHATILMTIYYNKPGPAYVTEKMAEAQARIADQEQQNFVRFLQNEEYRTASPLVLSNDFAGVSALGATSPTSWIIGDIGICPVSGLKCSEGGPDIGAIGQKKVYGPVPGGAKNCVRCRFFITGPAFLGGLVSQFNAIGLALSEVAGILRQVEADICNAEDSETDIDSIRQRKKLDLLYERKNRLMDDVDQIALNWHATYGLVERSRIAIRDAKDHKGAQGMSLVLSGSTHDLEVALSECTQFDLMDSVCQAGRIYPNTHVPIANLRRGRLLDAMLIRNGRNPVFASLSDDESLTIGNQMVEFLMTRCGRSNADDLIDGKRMLDSTGIAKDFETMLGSISSSFKAIKTDSQRISNDN